ncbi:MAG: beta-ketoacyl synthase [Aquabacterium sp.]|nr:MAG: beta-ketoacyl synthase [Aquabacterium sp.]
MEPIAIIGMGCIFPGAGTPDEYWRNLMERRDCSSELSQQELGVPPGYYHHPVPGTPDHIHYNRNGHVRGFRPRLDGWRIPAEELRTLDPLFHWTLHAAAQALEDAGRADAAHAWRRRCGLVIGNIGMPTHSGKRLLSSFYQRALSPYLQALLGRPEFSFHDAWPEQGLSELNLLTGSQNATVAAQALGLGGPCFALDAACASALYAIHVAGGYLHSGKADVMLAGSVCHADHVYIDHGFNVLQAFPREGRSIPFDRRSEGLKAGEGAGMVALKRLSDAVRDGDTIHGVIESIGLSNDAGAKHILVPDVQGQLLALQRAYAGRDRRIDYLECHATGTPVGDEVELGSAETFFGEAGAELPLVGANKGNIGHMLTASGMASILKVLLAMRHEVIPPTIGVEEMVGTPAARLGLDRVVREARPWPRGGPQARAGINAFGFGGVNGHMVLARHQPQAASPAPAARPAELALHPLAIVGLGVTLAGTQDVAGFEAVVREGASRIGPLPRTRWLGLEGREDLLRGRGLERAPQGAYIEALDFDCQHFKLPPKVVGSHLLSHLFLMPVAEQAFLDAGYEPGKGRRNISVIVAGDVDHGCLRYQARNEIAWQLRDSLRRCGIELDAAQAQALEGIAKEALFPAPYPEGITGGIGNVVASRIAAHLRLNGPAFSLCAHENAVFKAIEVAQFMLSQQLVEAVIVASGSFAGGLENVLWAPGSQARDALQPVGEGAGVLVLRREQDAVRSCDRIYAVIRGLAIEHAAGAHLTHAARPGDVEHAVAVALAQAGVQPGDVGYVELGAPPADAGAEAEGLARAYAAAAAPVHAGSVSANYGHLGAAQGMLGIVKAALCLHGRYLPPGAAPRPVPGHDAAVLQPVPQARPWDEPRGRPRLAAVNSIGLDRAHVHLLLQEPGDAERRAARQPVPRPARAGGLVVRVHTGRDRSMADIVLSPENRRLFTQPLEPQPSAADATAAGARRAVLTADPLVRQHLRNARSQLRFLQVEQAFYKRLHALLATDVEAPPRPDVLFDESQLLELTDGSVEKVLGPAYREADSYPIRTRMPSPPYMFVSRITAMSAQPGKLEPCFIEWEYDLDPAAWFAVDGRVGSYVALESSHAMIVAFTWIGCDQLFKGELRYRAVDSQTTVYAELPRAGETLVGRVDIKSFVRVGRSVLIAYEYQCRAGGRLCFKLEASSGFFLPRDMEKSKGVDPTPYLKGPRSGEPLRPLLRCERSSFGPEDIDALLRGDFAACFGPAYARPGVARLHAQDARMVDRVLSISADAGAYGLGEAVAERDIDPGHWAFKAHFKNDPVMPGTMLVEGCWQLANFFLSWLGLYSLPQVAAQELVNHRYSAKFRGEVKCQPETLRYRLTCKSIERGEAGIKLVFVAEIIYRGNVIGVCDNLGAGFTGSLDAPAAAAALRQPAIEV